jgi:hypothetical protein
MTSNLQTMLAAALEAYSVAEEQYMANLNLLMSGKLSAEVLAASYQEAAVADKRVKEIEEQITKEEEKFYNV